jgi:hypothetical protein
MTFNPLAERGIPLDHQIRDWRALDVAPLDPDRVDPATRCRVITMNAVEAEAVMFSHQFTRRWPDQEVGRWLSAVRCIEQQQRTVVNWLLPGTASALEATIAHEQQAVDLTAWVARMEPDPYLKQAYEFGLVEHLDHLYRYANLYELVEHRKAEPIVGGLTEVMPGRPTRLQHRHPADRVRKPYDRATVNPLSKFNALTVLATEVQLMNVSTSAGRARTDPIARQAYQEIALVEEGHVTHYETLIDPEETWWEKLVNHEYNECYLYHSFVEQEPDARVRAVWELHLGMELEHLRIACDLLRRFEGREPEEIVAPALPDALRFQQNKAYVRQVLANQLDLTTLGAGYVREPHERFEQMQRAINGGTEPPSERVVDEHRRRFGTDYRVETEGPHPMDDPRARAAQARLA